MLVGNMVSSSALVAALLLPLAAAFAPVRYHPVRHASSTTLWARQPVIAGNWKMNPTTLEEAKALAKATAEATTSETTGEIIIAVPFVFLESVKRELGDSGVKMAAQSIFFEDKGAFTGSISSCMVKTMGCEYVLAGHSERRSLFKDDDASINRKIRKSLKQGLRPILCIGESFDEYQSGLADVVCRIELSKDLKDVTEEELSRVIIAYEPVWSIGTGLMCDPNTAQKVHAGIRDWFKTKYSAAAADAIRITYGGSVTPETVKNLMKQPDIDGCLVGGASLDPEKWAKLINYTEL